MSFVKLLQPRRALARQPQGITTPIAARPVAPQETLAFEPVQESAQIGALDRETLAQLLLIDSGICVDDGKDSVLSGPDGEGLKAIDEIVENRKLCPPEHVAHLAVHPCALDCGL
jgi:hypothetical protein